MSKREKEIKRLKMKPKDLTYDELKSLLEKIGFIENSKGKTSGSGVEFKNREGKKILLHKPHPDNIIKMYKIKEILKDLEEWRIL